VRRIAASVVSTRTAWANRRRKLSPLREPAEVAYRTNSLITTRDDPRVDAPGASGSQLWSSAGGQNATTHAIIHAASIMISALYDLERTPCITGNAIHSGARRRCGGSSSLRA